MTIFFTLFTNLLPLYVLIALGYFAARVLKVDRQNLGTLAIYMFMPVVVFGFVARLDFKFEMLALPVVMFSISVITGLGALYIGRKVYQDSQANLLALCASMGNTGYFGLPLVFLFFTPEQTAIYIFMMLGGSVYEATFGYYIAARGAFDARTSLKKIIRFPSIYAITLGLIVNQSGLVLPETFWTYWGHFKGAYVVVGMMIVGAALAGVKKLVFGPRFLAQVIFWKFMVWPALAYGFVSLDNLYTHWFTPDIHNLLLVMSIVPPAANIAAFAAQMNLEPEKAATTILINTILALFYIPFMIWLFGIQAMP